MQIQLGRCQRRLFLPESRTVRPHWIRLLPAPSPFPPSQALQQLHQLQSQTLQTLQTLASPVQTSTIYTRQGLLELTSGNHAYYWKAKHPCFYLSLSVKVYLPWSWRLHIPHFSSTSFQISSFYHHNWLPLEPDSSHFELNWYILFKVYP